MKSKYLLRFIKDLKSQTMYPGYGKKIFTVKKAKVSLATCKDNYSKYHYLYTQYIVRDRLKKIRIYINSDPGTVYMDREDCFDKLSGCPIQLPAPTNEKEYRYLLKALNSIIFDPAWYKRSNEYMTEEWIRNYDDLL